MWHIMWHEKRAIAPFLNKANSLYRTQYSNVSSFKLLAYILGRKWLHYFYQSIAGVFYGIDNISDCILWFVERFILIKSFVNIYNGIC